VFQDLDIIYASRVAQHQQESHGTTISIIKFCMTPSNPSMKFAMNIDIWSCIITSGFMKKLQLTITICAFWIHFPRAISLDV
jgi:hypothetical protein